MLACRRDPDPIQVHDGEGAVGVWRSKNIVGFYNKRGAPEQWIKEGKGRVARGDFTPALSQNRT